MNATEIGQLRDMAEGFFNDGDRERLQAWARERELELEAKSIKGEQKTIRVYNSIGQPKDTTAVVIDGLGVHKAWGSGYNVSHVASGKCVVHVKTLRRGKVALRELLTLGVPWEVEEVTKAIQGETERTLLRFIQLTNHQGRAVTMDEARASA